ncbi:MAG: transglycosylase SLT domain-containing protein, partial [Bacillota bacterium]
LRMGTYYLWRVLHDVGDKVLAMAAYNAGPGRARRWRDERPLEGAIYVETIPFNETRDYVKKVVTNVWFYTNRLKGQAPALRQILGTIPGRANDPDGNVAASIP